MRLCSVSLTQPYYASAACVIERNFGCSSEDNSMWTQGGCRGTFMCNGADTGICGLRGKAARVKCSCLPAGDPQRFELNLRWANAADDEWRSAQIARPPFLLILPTLGRN